MLTAKDFREALVDLIRVKARLPYKVHFNHVNKSNESYVWIELNPQKRSWDSVYFQRIMNVEIHVILFPDTHAEVKHTNLMEISDALDAAIMPCFHIKDRFITVQEFNSHIFDDVLHYEFALDFTDYVPNDEYEGLSYELMQNLEVDLNRDTDRRIYFTEPAKEEPTLPDPSQVIQNLLGDD